MPRRRRRSAPGRHARNAGNAVPGRASTVAGPWVRLVVAAVERATRARCGTRPGCKTGEQGFSNSRGRAAAEGYSRLRVASLRSALPVARTAGCAPPAGVRVQLPRPAAGHPWPAGRTPRGARDGLSRSPAPARKAGAVTAESSATDHARALVWSGMEINSGSAEIVDCHSGRRSSRLNFSQTPRQLGARRGRGGMSRAGHGWPAAGCGSRTRRYPAGHPPVAAAGCPEPRTRTASLRGREPSWRAR